MSRIFSTLQILNGQRKSLSHHLATPRVPARHETFLAVCIDNLVVPALEELAALVLMEAQYMR